MANLRIEAFFREFKFLNDLLKKENFVDFKVQRMDVELLDRRFELDYKYEGGLVIRTIPGKIRGAFLDKNGKLLLTVTEFPSSPNKQMLVYQDVVYVWYKPSTWRRRYTKKLVPNTSPDLKSETTLEALRRLGDRVNEVAFMLAWDFWGKVILYKAPRPQKIDEWIEEEISKKQIEIRMQTSVIF